MRTELCRRRSARANLAACRCYKIAGQSCSSAVRVLIPGANACRVLQSNDHTGQVDTRWSHSHRDTAPGGTSDSLLPRIRGTWAPSRTQTRPLCARDSKVLLLVAPQDSRESTAQTYPSHVSPATIQAELQRLNPTISRRAEHVTFSYEASTNQV